MNKTTSIFIFSLLVEVIMLVEAYFLKASYILLIAFAVTLFIAFLIFNYYLTSLANKKAVIAGKLNTLKESERLYGEKLASSDSEEIKELKKLEVFRKEFLGNVSHELKTPIFNIQGYIHTLLDGGIHDKEVNVQYLKRAARSAERLSLIVDDLESISKLESGVLVLDERIFDIYELIKDVYDSLELKTKEKNISLKFEKGSAHPVYVNADKERIRQVIVNLTENAINYGRSNGSVTTSFHELEDRIIVEIKDNGIGIDSAHLPRIFERFYRVDQSRSRAAGGTGLGLAIVKHIIEAHRQTINVYSALGEGTTFTFSLKKA